MNSYQHLPSGQDKRQAVVLVFGDIDNAKILSRNMEKGQ